MGKRLAVIGCGNMGSAVVRGLLKVKWTTAAQVVASHPKKERAAAIAKALGIDCLTSNLKAAESADVVLLGVKPQIMPEVLAELRGAVSSKTLVLIMAACIPTRVI
ncbi:MAG: pyrroline-5-carboxylate reductase [Thermoplasmata archaeon]|nr:pyrroline-5-carboxylate reductase [Thermoplasmata archaeon]